MGSEPCAIAGRVSVPFVVLLVLLCSGGSLLFSCLGVSCGCLYVMHVPM